MGLIFKSNTWGSGEVRGRQIAQRLGVPCDDRISPESIVVVVKQRVLDAEETLDYVKSLWIDVVDGYGLIEDLLAHPRMKAIAIGPMSKAFIRRRVMNRLETIPEHHCNFENWTRPKDRDVRVVGAMCYPGNFDVDSEEIRKALRSIGMEFRLATFFRRREDVVRFYKKIDIQLCIRFWRGIGQKEPPELKNPLKLENAGSFQIPTVAFPEPCFLEEFGEDTFIHILTMDDIVESCKVLKSNRRYYEDYAMRAWKRAQDYHIDRIAPLYLELD